ncbi:bifunctional DNA primase/polymerase [Nitrospira sp. Nam74]
MKERGEREHQLLTAAVSYVRKGWSVLPLHSPRKGQCSCNKTECEAVGKHPCAEHGLNDATLNIPIIQAWWERWPRANVGVVTGRESGLVVLDIDPRHSGDNTLAQLEEQHGKLPATVESLTGGGGRHILFQHPGGYIKSRSIGQGLDIKADGGYIVAPPSVHLSGETYVWEVSSHPEDTPVSSMPGWLHKLVTNGALKPKRCHAHSPERIPEGTRNNTLTSLGGTMRSSGMTHQAIKAALLHENEQRCDPPLDDEEVHKIAASVSQYAPSDQIKPCATLPRTETVGPIALDCPPNIAVVRQTVETHFPNLWPAVDLGLATCATLLLADNANPAAMIFMGPAATGKTTVATMFSATMCYRSDKFTPAAFVSHSAKATPEQLKAIDLLPRIQHKVLVTPELSTMFRGKPDDLLERFSIITRVLDGQGLISDSGTHGRRGYEGDYLFACSGVRRPLIPVCGESWPSLGAGCSSIC